MSAKHHHPHSPAARLEPRSVTQRQAVKLYSSADILFLLGPAGCGKSTVAMGLAAVDVLSPSSPRDVVLCIRPAVQADRQLGHLPGELGEKLEPYTTPIRQALAKVSFRFPPEKLRFEALGYCRGMNFDRAVVVVDEAQNLTFKQFLLLISRLGENSKLIITGDPDQADIHSTGDYHTDLEEVVDSLEDCPGVSVVDFPEGECHRHPVLRHVLPRLRR